MHLDQLWGKVNKNLQALGLSAWPRVIVHDRWYLAKVLDRKHYFFNDIFVEGIALYDSGVFVPQIREKLTPEERREAAQEHFEHWFEKAQGFWKTYHFQLAENELILAAFSLQQTAESAYNP